MIKNKGLTSMEKAITCWYCKSNGKNILDEYGCCKRCGTNLKKWKKREDLKYPIKSQSQLENEVLGCRQSCDLR
jgi:rRNA maturation endonuclease Nob1